MDGLVSNTALIAGVAAGRTRTPWCSAGVAGLLAGAFSMALGEYTSVTTANEQIDSEVRVERRASAHPPQAEQAELVGMLVDIGMTEKTARSPPMRSIGTRTVRVNFHLVKETGVNPARSRRHGSPRARRS